MQHFVSCINFSWLYIQILSFRLLVVLHSGTHSKRIYLCFCSAFVRSAKWKYRKEEVCTSEFWFSFFEEMLAKNFPCARFWCFLHLNLWILMFHFDCLYTYSSVCIWVYFYILICISAGFVAARHVRKLFNGRWEYW